MTVEKLPEFIEHKMSMSHVYQPVLIRALVDAGGTATVRQLAHALLLQDENELKGYEATVRKMPVPVLRKHGVIAGGDDLIKLSVGPLTLQERAQIRAACERRLQSYVAGRGEGIWDYKALDVPVPGSLRYRVLRMAKDRCAACGTKSSARPLDVDHIIPRSRGGKTVIENLQALCSKCNRAKGNRDDTDFRTLPLDVDPACPFCSETFRAKAVKTNGTVFAVQDGHPVTRGHTLLIPIRHVAEWFSMTDLERQHTEELLRVLRAELAAEDRKIEGFNIGANCGEVAGQTVMHAHLQLIPRRRGDVEKPRGGVRGLIPSKMSSP